MRDILLNIFFGRVMDIIPSTVYVIDGIVITGSQIIQYVRTARNRRKIKHQVIFSVDTGLYELSFK